MSRNICTVVLVLASLSITPFALDAAEIGPDGGINLTVSFEEDTGISSTIPAPLDDPLAEQHYCDAFQEFSRALYATTEGAHWIRRVRFYEDANVRDIRWNFQTEGGFSSAKFQSWMKIREAGYDNADPYNPPLKSPGSLGRLMNHEFGHFFYGLPDEYIHKTSGGGRNGFCDDGAYQVVADEGIGTPCDDEALACGGNACILWQQCIEGDSELIGTSCAADDECGSGGICLGTSEDRNDLVEKKRICLHATELSAGDDSLGVCLMAGGGLRKRWCDGGLDPDGVQIADANHVYTFDQMLDYGVDVEFDLGNTPGLPDGSDGARDFHGYNCWDEAASHYLDLEGVHAIGSYPTIDEIEADNGPVPAVQCEWLIDGLGSDNHAMLVVDRSGSMDYVDLSGTTTAVDLALDGALYFYNQVDVGDYAGVLLYNDIVTTATSGGSNLDFDVKNGDIDSIDSVGAFNGTDIAEAFIEATDDILNAPGAPQAEHNIVLFSDGKDNQGGDPFAAAQAACDAGISVHTISFGDADSDALDQMAACGTAWVTGTEVAGFNGWEEPDPFEIKSAIARMQHHIDGDDEILEYRDFLEPPSVANPQERLFEVPVNSPQLTVTWLGDRTCYFGADTGSCDLVFDELAFEIESPSGVVKQATILPGMLAGIYRTIEIRDPEPGIWTARVDVSEPNVIFIDPNEWETRVPEARISWLAYVGHPGLLGQAWVRARRAPLDAPVVINAAMEYEILATDIFAVAVVTHEGGSWEVPMFDDGLHGDDEPGDGLYGGIFNQDGTLPGLTTGAYRVKVTMQSRLGRARGVAALDEDEDGAPDQPIRHPGSATVEAETSFRLSDRYTWDDDGDPNPGLIAVECLDMVRGDVLGVWGTVQGFALDPESMILSYGEGVELSNLSVGCSGCQFTGGPPTYSFSADATIAPDARLGRRDVAAQVGVEVIQAENACRVCASPACEEIEIEMTPIAAGSTAELTAYGPQPGETVYFAGSTQGDGPGPCPPVLGGLCLDILSPVLPLGTAIADASGKATAQIAVPANLPPDTKLFVQAAVVRGPGGVDSVKSNVVADGI